jgi:nicotine oxidoreductase
MLTAPIHDIVKKLEQAGYHKSFKGVTRGTWIELSGSQIINLANSIINGYLNYYSFAYNKGKLAGIMLYLIRDCVLRTLAAKFKIRTRAGVLKKFGKNLSMYDYSNITKLPLNKRKAKLINKLTDVSYKTNI